MLGSNGIFTIFMKINLVSIQPHDHNPHSHNPNCGFTSLSHKCDSELNPNLNSARVDYGRRSGSRSRFISMKIIKIFDDTEYL